ncbi:hypothetical protein [Flexithrix dorotheae]|uniref:hypothetical protein n=1 Tax=Flexithrix dorotheae TaxID=70993 RepID=UPI000371DFF0|nr:hypothetical protein [Flexithrix dorotheae]
MNQSKFVNKVNLKRTLLVVATSILISGINVLAQQQQDYIHTYEQAQFDYQNGKVYKVIELEKSVPHLPNYLKDDAYYLLFNSYVQTLQDSMAFLSMQKLLRENPGIDPKNEDEKFRYFYQKFRSKPREIGLMVGQNLHIAKTPASRNNKGFSIAFVHNQYINHKFIFFKNLIYAERHQTINGKTGKYKIPGTYVGQTNIDPALADLYNVDAKDYPQAIYHLAGDTYPSFLELASGLQWNFISNKRLQIFISGGLAINYLIENSFGKGEIYLWEISYDENNNNGELNATYPYENPFILAESRDAEHKTLFNINYMAGAGFRYKINDGGILFLEGRWQQSVIPQEVTFSSESGEFEQILEPFETHSIKFQTRTLTFSFGYLFTIQHFQKLKR